MKQYSVRIHISATMLMVAGVAWAAPRLVIPETTFNFGFVPQNSKLSHVFLLESRGEDSLHILKVVPGCGCTQAPLEKSALAAGESTRLEVIFDTRHYTGKVTKRPTIQTNEGPPDKFVQFDCEVMSRPDSTYPVVITPYKLDISQFGEKVRDQMKFKIANLSEEALTVTACSVPDDFVTLTLPSSVPPSGSAEGTIKLKSDVLKKQFEKSITIQLGDAKNTRFTIPVKRSLRLPGDTTQAAEVQGKSIETR